jgi:hydroxypyruvate isomerase
LPSTYTYPSPVSLFKTGEDTKEITVTNDYSYGKELSVSPTCASVEAEIIEALENVKTIYNRQQAQLIFPFEQVYTPGTKLNLKDVSQILPIVGSVNVRSITINFDTFEYVIQGDMI